VEEVEEVEEVKKWLKSKNWKKYRRVDCRIGQSSEHGHSARWRPDVSQAKLEHGNFARRSCEAQSRLVAVSPCDTLKGMPRNIRRETSDINSLHWQHVLPCDSLIDCHNLLTGAARQRRYQFIPPRLPDLFQQAMSK
jgi:hypothetical protein